MTAPERSAWRDGLGDVRIRAALIVVGLLFARALSWVLVGMEDLADISAKLRNLVAGFVQLLGMALPMLVAITLTSSRGPRAGPRRFAALAVAVIGSAFVGVLIRIALWRVLGFDPGWEETMSMVRIVWPRNALFGLLLTVGLELYRRELASAEAAQRAAVDRAALESETAASRLHVLQAQIEPHFLFNSLANIRRLHDLDPAAGGEMLEHLMRYLEVALPQMRASETTVGREAELIDAYLRLHQIRMGRRLVFGIDVPPELRPLRIPPMMLLTLVENAVKHGIAPAIQGGAIRVSASAGEGQLTLTVADSGAGLTIGSGTGTGLANVRARLATQFGDRARLALGNNELGGVTASISLPLPAAEKAA